VKKAVPKQKNNGLLAPSVQKPKAKPKPIPVTEPSALAVQQRALCRHLLRWMFTDFEQAKAAIETLSGVINAKTPHDIRLVYHRSASFLENQWNRFESAIDHARQAIAICESMSDVPALIELWSDLAAIQLNSRDWAACQESLDHARRYTDENTPDHLRAHIACREGFMHLHTGNQRQALACLMEAEKNLFSLNETSALKDFYLLTLILSGLGDLYERLDEKEKSLDAYRRVLPIVEAHDLRPRLAWHYLNAGRSALAGEDAQQAGFWFEKVLEYAGEADAEAKTHALGNLGILALMQNDAKKASSMFDAAAAQYDPPAKESDFTNLSKIEIWRSGIFRQSGDLPEAEKHLQNAWRIGLEGHDKYHLAQVCQQIAALNALKSEFAAAYEWQQRATLLNHEYFDDLRDYERRELEARYQLERSRQDAQMARLRVAGLQLRALRAQMNPHFMFNALNAIQGLITSGRNSDAESYLAKFAKLMRHTLDYSDLEVVTLEQEIEFLDRYLDINRKLRFRDRLHFSIIPPKGADMDDLYVPTMILQPFVENAIEHGLRPRQEGTMRIVFTLGDDENILICTIEDDGVGYNKGREKQSGQQVFQKHRSRGMDITRERLGLIHQIQKTGASRLITITDLGEESGGAKSGTRVEVYLPLMDPS
jgi:two-component system LytT family sensor kinase